MALIKCSECGKEISDKAKKCPSCGYKTNKKNIKKTVKKVSIKIGKIGKNILFGLSVVIIVFFMIIALILLYDQITGIGKLNYPLTAILPIISCLIGVAFLVILFISMNKWRKNKKVKKYFKLALILLIVTIISFEICSPINLAIQNNNIGYRYQGVESHNIKGITYDVPAKWRTEDASDGYYHYLTPENSDGFLYVSANSYNVEENDIKEFYVGTIDEMKELQTENYFKMISQNHTKIMGKDAYKARYKTIVSDVYLEVEIYLLYDLDTNMGYAFMFNVKDSITDDIEKNIEEIIDSIRER